MNLTPENTMERILSGEDVTPSCRAEYFVKQAITNAGSGGGGDTYETVAEIAVGQMEEETGLYNYTTKGQYDVQVDPTAEYYLQPQNIRLNAVIGDEANGFAYNFDAETGKPTDTPTYAFELTSRVAVVVSDTDLSNTTVKILKKVGGETITVDSALSGTSENPVQNKVITAALGGLKPTYEFGFTATAGQTEGEFIVTPDSGSTYAAITAALAETPNVYAVFDLGFRNQVIRALFSVDNTTSGAESTSAIAMFWGGTKWLGARLMVSASGADLIVREI